MNYFTEQEASSRETSIEIMESLSEITGSKKEADELWEDPKGMGNKIIERAWELAGDEEDELYWGENVITRG